MPSYTANTRSTKQDTGSNPGSWGSVANTQIFDMLDEALGFVSYAMPDSNQTQTISDGASSNARAMCILVTGTFTAGRTLTLAPNTSKKVWIVRNGTTGGFDLTVSQGSGANVVIPAGYAAVVYGDGAGGGADIINALNGLLVTNIQGTVTTASQPTIDHDTLANFVANEHIDHTSVSIATAAGSGLSGGGTIAASRNLVLDIDGLTAESTLADADTIPFNDDGVGVRKVTLANLASYIFDINGLGSATPVATDTLPFYDVDAAAEKKATIDTIVGVAALPAANLTGTIASARLSGAYTAVTSIGASNAVQVNGSGQFSVFNTTPASQPLDLGALTLLDVSSFSNVNDELDKVETWINNLRTNVLRALGLTA